MNLPRAATMLVNMLHGKIPIPMKYEASAKKLRLYYNKKLITTAQYGTLLNIRFAYGFPLQTIKYTP